jgi:hypothetical protein
MNEAAVWAIIDKGKRSGEPEAVLKRQLERRSPQEIAAFDRQFGRLVDRAFRWDLWGAAYLIEGGCSEDGFVYFLYGLIARGRQVYEAALADPDSLAGAKVHENEEFGGVACEVYQERTDKSLRRRRPSRSSPTGRRWDFENAAENARRLPLLAAAAARAAKTASKSSAGEQRPKARRPLSRKSVLANVRFDAMFQIQLRHDQGAAKANAGDQKGANAEFRAALAEVIPGLQRHPSIPLLHINLASFPVTPAEKKRARAHFEAARRARRNLAAHPDHLATLDNLLACFLWEHDYRAELGQALVWARGAVKHASDPLPAMDTEMRILLSFGRDAEAQKIAIRALKLDPACPYFQDVKKRWGIATTAKRPPKKKRATRRR